MNSSKQPDRDTFEVILKSGLVVSRALARTKENGQARYFPTHWEVCDYAGHVYAKGSTQDAAIDAAYERVSSSRHLWRVLVNVK